VKNSGDPPAFIECSELPQFIEDNNLVLLLNEGSEMLKQVHLQESSYE
jgi:hypothetical protein